MTRSMNSTLATVSVLNMLVHALGSCLLISVYKKGKKTVQHMLLINLSLTELTVSFMFLLQTSLEIADARIYPIRNITTNSTLFSRRKADRVGFSGVALNVVFCSL